MARYRRSLPQLEGGLFLCDAGLETDLIFNHGIEVREFAAHTLLPDAVGREALANYFRGFLALAREQGTGFILDSQTWKAHPHWADDLGQSEEELRQANHDAVGFIAGLRDEFADNERPVVLNGLVGPRGDAYAPDARLAAAEAERYHSRQIGWLAETEVDMISALTFTQADEAVGVVRAARAVELPVAVSFTVETDGRLPTGQPLGEAIESVDRQTDGAAAYFMINCAHPEHLAGALEDAGWARRLLGIRGNASRMSHAELDESTTLDDGDPAEFALQCEEIAAKLPWLNLFGGCCGSDLRHVAAIARKLSARFVRRD